MVGCHPNAMTDTQDRRFNDTKDRIAEHLSNGLTVLQISRLLGISPSAVYKHIKRYDLPLPSEKEVAS